MFNEKLINKSKLLLELARKSSVKIATAESCTAGLVSALITEMAGSSSIFDRGFVTYSNLAKQESLGVSADSLEKYGAVSKQVAEEMARGVLCNSAADISVSITGIAGPDGGCKEKPVGLVHISSFNKINQKIINKEFHFSGDRSNIRTSSVEAAIIILIDQIIETSI